MEIKPHSPETATNVEQREAICEADRMFALAIERCFSDAPVEKVPDAMNYLAAELPVLGMMSTLGFNNIDRFLDTKMTGAEEIDKIRRTLAPENSRWWQAIIAEQVRMLSGFEKGNIAEGLYLAGTGFKEAESELIIASKAEGGDAYVTFVEKRENFIKKLTEFAMGKQAAMLDGLYDPSDGALSSFSNMDDRELIQRTLILIPNQMIPTDIIQSSQYAANVVQVGDHFGEFLRRNLGNNEIVRELDRYCKMGGTELVDQYLQVEREIDNLANVRDEILRISRGSQRSEAASPQVILGLDQQLHRAYYQRWLIEYWRINEVTRNRIRSLITAIGDRVIEAKRQEFEKRYYLSAAQAEAAQREARDYERELKAVQLANDAMRSKIDFLKRDLASKKAKAEDVFSEIRYYKNIYDAHRGELEAAKKAAEEAERELKAARQRRTRLIEQKKHNKRNVASMPPGDLPQENSDPEEEQKAIEAQRTEQFRQAKEQQEREYAEKQQRFDQGKIDDQRKRDLIPPVNDNAPLPKAEIALRCLAGEHQTVEIKQGDNLFKRCTNCGSATGALVSGEPEVWHLSEQLEIFKDEVEKKKARQDPQKKKNSLLGRWFKGK